MDKRLDNVFVTVTPDEKKLLESHKKEVQKLLDLYTTALEANLDDYKDIQEKALRLFLEINGLEIASEEEKETCPFAIAMHTSGKKGVEWEHWGLDVHTLKGPHTFDTVPGSAVGHRPMTFERVNPTSSKSNTFTIPVKNLLKEHVDMINEALDHFVEAKKHGY